MTLIIAVVSQKGGVGKSTLARMLAVEYARNKWNVKIADMDVSQSTSYLWNARRMERDYRPEISVEQFPRVNKAMQQAGAFDLFIFDGAPHSTVATLEIAKQSDLILLPTGASIDDLEPTVRLAHELKNKGIDRRRLFFVLSRLGNSEAENAEAKEYLDATGYQTIKAQIHEKTGYRRASDLGFSCTETAYKSLNQKAETLAQEVADRANELMETQ